MTAFTVVPDTIRVNLTLRALSPISHHDASARDKSNTLLFNRQRQLAPPIPTADDVDLGTVLQPLREQYLIPTSMRQAFLVASVEEYVGAALVKLFIDAYNSKDGAGIFTGTERYNRLETRLKQAAEKCRTLNEFWVRLTTELRIPLTAPNFDYNASLILFYSLPEAVQIGVLQALEINYRNAIIYARVWRDKIKAGEEMITAPISPLRSRPRRYVDVPALSGNGLRHTLLRAPLAHHLFASLEIPETFPGQSELPPAVEALFVNGGNIANGAKTRPNAHGLAEQIRRLYPQLDLLGGTIDSFDLGASRVTVTPYVICRENKDALTRMGVTEHHLLDTPAEELIGETTLTRTGTKQGVGQMIYNFETLIKDAEVFIQFRLERQTPALTRGAFATALTEYMAHDPRIGGQSRVGFGLVGHTLETFATAEEDEAAYRSYITENKDELRTQLIASTLGTDVVLL